MQNRWISGLFIVVKIKELPNPEREMIKEVITLCKLILINPATSAAGERNPFRLPGG